MVRKYILAAAATVVGVGALGGYQGFLASNMAAAATVKHVDFTTAAFAAAQKAGKPILIDVWASWRPTCKAQQPGIAAAKNIAANSELIVMRINYDTQKAEMKPFRITRQSTLIAFKGKRETGRAIAVTEPYEIAKLVATTR